MIFKKLLQVQRQAASQLLYTWGNDSANGALAFDDSGVSTSVTTPKKIGKIAWKQVSYGNEKRYDVLATDPDTYNELGLGIDTTNNLYAWGNNDVGQAGVPISSTTFAIKSPTQIGTSYVYTAAGVKTSYGIKQDGTLWSWGSNAKGALGINSDIVPTTSVYNQTKWKQLYRIGLHGFIAIADNDTLWAWGYNNVGQLGLNDRVDRESPTQIGTDTWSKIVVSEMPNSYISVFGMRTDGTLWGWGSNGSGELGDGTLVQRSSPVQIGTGYTWTDVTSYARVAHAIRSDGTLWSWGNNNFTVSGGLSNVSMTGAVGDGTTVNKSSPVQIGGLTKFKKLGNYCRAIDVNDNVWSWGFNNYTLNASIGTGGSLGTAAKYVLTHPQQNSWAQISAGRFHTLAIRNDGTLWSWGSNSSGQLGLGNQTLRSSPVQVGSNSNWIQVSTGDEHSFAINNNRELFGWGSNFGGQLGLGDRTLRTSPTKIDNFSYTQVSAGISYSTFIRSDSTLWVTGANDRGQLGDGTVINRSLPVQVAGSWSQVSAKYTHTMAISTNGALWGWGYNINNQLGDGTNISRSSPVQISASSWTQVNAGQGMTAAIRSDGTLWGWGENYYTFDTTTNAKSLPVKIGTSSWTQATVDNLNILAIKIDGTLWGWGFQSFGQLGDGTTISRSSPVQIGTSSWTQVSFNTSHASAITANGQIFSWGAGTSYQIGDGNAVSRSSPVQVGNSKWTMVGFTSATTHAIRNDGTLWSWGSSQYGLLGDTTTVDRSSPVQVGSNTWKYVSNNIEITTHAIRTNGTLWGWGRNASGNIGDNTSTDRSSPVQIGADTNWNIVESRYSHTAGLKIDGTLWTWGNNNNGQLGDGTRDNKSSPVQVGGSWSQVAVGDSFMAAIKPDSTLWVWGANTNGELGQNKVRLETEASQASWTQISSFNNANFAIRSDGLLFAWGYNISGQLGDGTRISRSSPVQIGTSSWTQVSAGLNHTAAIRADGALFTWGDSIGGALGDGTNISRSSPVQVGTSSWIQVDANVSRTMAIRADNILFATGFNAGGTFGDGTLQSADSFIQIGTDSWSQVSSGTSHTAGIKTDGTLWTWGSNAFGQITGTGSVYVPRQVGVDSWTQVSANYFHTHAIRADGTLWAWGQNDQGVLGDGTANSRSSPVQIGTLSWTQINANNNHILGITLNGSLYAWGSGAFGKNGNSSSFSTSLPVQISAGTSWSKVSANLSSSMAIDNTGKVYTFGANAAGALGVDLNPTDFSSSSLPIPAFTKAFSLTPLQVAGSWTKVAATNAAIAAIKTDGTMWAWGDNVSGRLGDGFTGSNNSRSSPVQIGTAAVSSGNFKWIDIASLPNGFIAESEELEGSYNKLYGWGLNDGWILSTSGAETSIFPGFQRLRFNGTAGNYAIPSFIRGARHAGIIGTDGSLWMFGKNSYGQLGNIAVYNDPSCNSPVQVGTSEYALQPMKPFDLKVKKVVHSENYTNLAISNDDKLYFWGSNSNNNIVGPTNNLSDLPALVTNNVQDVAIANNKVYYVRNNKPYTTGYDFTLGTTTGTPLLLDNKSRNITSVQVPNKVTSNANQALAVFNDSTGNNYVYGRYVELQYSAFQSQRPYYPGWTINELTPFGQYNYTDSPVQVASSDQFESIATNNGVALAIRKDGTLFAWGDNTKTLYGDGSTYLISRSSPTQIGRLNGWQQVVVSDDLGSGKFMLGIKTDGTLWGWGTNFNGQLGIGNKLDRSSPVQIGASSWSQVSASGPNSYAIRIDGTLWGWGLNLSGQLGDNTTVAKSSPIQIGTSSWSQVSAGVSNVHAITIDGRLFAWGNNTSGNLGDGTEISKSSPVQIGTDSWIEVSNTKNNASGLRGAYAIRSDGTLWAWGNNNNGRLGDNTAVNKSSPVQIGTDSWSQVNASSTYAVGIKADKSLWIWGRLDSGLLGDNIGLAFRSSPVQVGTDSWSQVSAGSVNIHAIKYDGTLWGWGQNLIGNLGDGTSISRSSPIQISAKNNWAKVSTIGSNAAVIDSNGALYTWGINTSGQLGFLDELSRTIPTQLGWKEVDVGTGGVTAVFGDVGYTWGTENKVAGLSWKQIESAGGQAAAIRSDGALFTWGLNYAGALGNPSLVDGVFYSSPVQVGLSSWNQISVSQSFMSAIRSDGTLWTWGNNISGALGNGSNDVVDNPSYTNTTWQSTAFSSSGGSYGIKSDGTLWVWGTSGYGNLANLGTTLSSPVLLSASSWNQVSTNGLTTYAIRNDGSLWHLGRDANGTFDSIPWDVNKNASTAITRSELTQIGTSSWTQVSVGSSHVLAIRADGALFGQGYNTYGQLGTTDLAWYPAEVDKYKWNKIVVGPFCTAALDENNYIWVWGYYIRSSTLNSPYQLTKTPFRDVYVMTDAILAIDNNGELWGAGKLADGGAAASTDMGALGNPKYNGINVTTFTKLLSDKKWLKFASVSSSTRTQRTVLAIAEDGTLWGWGSIGSGGAFTDQYTSFPISNTSTYSWSQVNANNNYVMAIRSDGTLWGWGANSSAGIGDNTRTDKSSPVLVSSSSWSQVSTGGAHTLAIRSDGTLWAWGSNTWGTIGDNTVTSRSSPVQIGTDSWTSVSAGGTYSLAIKLDGTLWGWGYGAGGSVGDNTNINRSSPVQIGTSSWSQISASTGSNIALRVDGKIFTWGDNLYGKLGDGTVINRSSPVQIGTSSWTQVSAGPSNIAAIRVDGTLWGWGQNTDSQAAALGTNYSNRSSPIQIGTSSWTQVLTGTNRIVARKADNTYWFIGGMGELGSDITYSYTTGNELVPFITTKTVSQLSYTVSNTFIIDNNGILYRMGSNNNVALGIGFTLSNETNGQLVEYFFPLGHTTYINSPVQIGTDTWQSVHIGDRTVFGIKTNNTLWAWGSNRYGLKGLAHRDKNLSMAQVGTSSWTQISVNTSNAVAIRSDGTLWSWGDNSSGNVGDGSSGSNNSRSSPVQIAVGNTFKKVHAPENGIAHAIHTNGTLWRWNNSNTNIPVSQNSITPIQISADIHTDVVGNCEVFALIKSDKKAYMFGRGGSGGLGTSSVANPSLPFYINYVTNWVTVSNWTPIGQYQVGFSFVQIGTSSWSQVTARVTHSAAISADGKLFTWGGGAQGQLGDGTTSNRSSPVQIGTSSWTQVTIGNAQTLAITVDGALFAWGSNFNGLLGDGTTTNKSSPVKIGTSSWSKVAASTNASVAIRADGTLWAWGAQIDSVNRSSPVQVGAASNWTKLESTTGSTNDIFAAIDSTQTVYVGGNVYATYNSLFYPSGTISTSVGRSFPATARAIKFGSKYYSNSPIQISTSSWTQVKSNNLYTMAIRADGALFGWGFNGNGQIGDSTVAGRSSPVQIGTSSWSQVSAGFSHTLAIRTDGALFVWGNNNSGMLGDNTIVNKSSPVQISTSSWSQVSAGFSHSHAIRTDGTLWGWGYNLYVLVGDGTTISRSSPVQVGAGSTWKNVRTQAYATPFGINYAIDANDDLWAWGKDLENASTPNVWPAPRKINGAQYKAKDTVRLMSNAATITSGTQYVHLLDGSITTRTNNLFTTPEDTSIKLNDTITSPSKVSGTWKSLAMGKDHVLGVDTNNDLYGWGEYSAKETIESRKFTDIASSYLGTHAIEEDGTLWGWGYNLYYGELGIGDTMSRSSPVQIGTSKWKQVSRGLYHTLAIRSDGALFAWGDNTYGQFADGTVISKSSPVQIGTNSWSQVSAGNLHSLALRSDSTLWAWGYNGIGQLGDGTLISRSSPVQIGTSSWSQVSACARSDHNHAIRADGALFAWGYNGSGQFGDGTTISRSSPVQIGTSSWSQVDVGRSFSAGITSDGRLFTWGYNGFGQLGLGDFTTRQSPVQVGTSSWSQVDAGSSHTVAIRVDNTLWAWGDNTYGQIGDNTRINRSSPVQIATGSTWKKAQAAEFFTTAIRADGSVFAWGRNDQDGMVPDGTRINRSSPVQIAATKPKLNLYSWSQIESGNSHTVAIRSDGTLWAWGGNFFGQVGDGTTISKSSPVQISTSSWTSVSAGYNYNIAIRADGTLWGWGANAEGQLGDGTKSNRASPVQIGTDSWIQITAGGDGTGNHTLAIRVDGTLWGWGYNFWGTLGDGTTISKSSPIQIGTDSWTQVSSSLFHTHAIRADGTLWGWGNNSLGRLGTTSADTSSPVQIGTSSWTQVAVTTVNTHAIRADGTLWGWGANATGTVGNNTTGNNPNSPVLVSASSWSQVGAVTAIRIDGTLWAWGTNTYGEVGDGTKINRSSPVQIGIGRTWSKLSQNSENNKFAIDSTGIIYVAGLNTYGELGDNTIVNRDRLTPVYHGAYQYYIPTPTKIGLSKWRAVEAGTNTSHAIDINNNLYGWGNNTFNTVGLQSNFVSTPTFVKRDIDSIDTAENATGAITILK